jgi:hypothetical protein
MAISKKKVRKTRTEKSFTTDHPLQVWVKTERIISDRPINLKLTEGKNEFDPIVDGYNHGYGKGYDFTNFHVYP